MFISRKRLEKLEDEVDTLRAAVWNLQNLTRILERDKGYSKEISVTAGILRQLAKR